MLIQETFSIAILGTGGAELATVAQTIKPAGGRLVRVDFFVPTLDNGSETAKVALEKGGNANVVYLADTVVGSGTCADNAWTSAQFPSTNGSYYPLPVDTNGLTARITANAAQAATRTFLLILTIEVI